MDETVYKIYIDGACPGNGTDEAVGGMGFAQEGKLPLSIPYTDFMRERYGPPTNQKTELMAALMLVYVTHIGIRRLWVGYMSEIHTEIYSDSKYVVDGVNIWLHNWKANGWKNSKKQPVANMQMWKDFDAFLSYGDHRGLFSFFHVAGHSGNKLNDKADEAAVYAASTNKGDENHIFMNIDKDAWSEFMQTLAECYESQL